MAKKILIVEDDSILARMYQKKFEISGYEVKLASNGAEGLIIAMNAHPDLILLDLMMPETNGVEMMDQIRKDQWGKNEPIIVLTNLDPNDEIIQHVVVDQPSYYILKSNSTPEDVLERVKVILG